LRNPFVEYPLYLVLGLICGATSAIFKESLNQGKKIFNSEPLSSVPKTLTPVLGSVFTGIVALQLPQVLFFGYETLDALLAGGDEFTLPVLVSLFVAKNVCTAICLGSGLIGGTFAPALFVGATVGAAYNKLVSILFSGGYDLIVLIFGSDAAISRLAHLQIAEAPAYAMVGMASTLAGVFGAPLTASVLLFELTR